ncbi:MAG: DUF4838 domain-containing protein [Lentisphaeria bacterium]|nr:DUF4838 domain-containing protein [Lentisphaeria bacterium]
MKSKFFLMLAGIITFNICYGAIIIDNSYKAKAEIKELISAEKTALAELNTYLNKIFGKTAEKDNKFVILRYDEKLSKEEFTISSDKKGNIIISGGRPRGVMYGVYYFLDRKLGVKWLTADDEYVPTAENIKIEKVDYHGKPVFNARIFSSEVWGKNSEKVRRWCARNFINGKGGKIYPADEKFGEELMFSPPTRCHGLFQIVTPAKYFKSNPEFWALQNGKRTHRDKRGLTADYCLTNEKLAEAAAKECREFLKKNPTARYISIQEGDFTKGYCDCTPCKKLVKECGNRESTRWVFFANRVAKILKDEFPQTKFLIFAYTASRQPPVNIKAEDNVCVQLCAWNNRRGQAYNHPKNKIGNTFLKQLEEWKKVCKNILIWDYTYTFSDRLLPAPDLLLNIDNFKAFNEIGIDGIYPENGAPEEISYGMPFKAWLLPRIMWNPAECGNGEELENIFCESYYGKKGGKYVAEYYKLLRDVNRKQGFVNYTSGGVIGKAAFESPEITAKGYELFKKAIAEEKDTVLLKRLKTAMLHAQYQVIRNFSKVQKIGKFTESYDDIVNDMINLIKADKNTTAALKNRFIKNINSFALLKNIKADASQLYANYLPAKAYDGKIDTYWHAANSTGWCQIEFDNVKEISRITTVHGSSGSSHSGEYSISGSLDGKNWFVIKPKTFVGARDNLKWVYSDDVFETPVKAKFIRTYRLKAFTERKIRNDVAFYEQWFNLKELPKELFVKTK